MDASTSTIASPPSSDTDLHGFVRAVAPQVLEWLLQNYEVADETHFVSRGEVYDHYKNSFCQERDITPLTSAMFGKVLRRAFPNVQTKRIGIKSGSAKTTHKYCYIGLTRRSTNTSCCTTKAPAAPATSTTSVDILTPRQTTTSTSMAITKPSSRAVLYIQPFSETYLPEGSDSFTTVVPALDETIPMLVYSSPYAHNDPRSAELAYWNNYTNLLTMKAFREVRAEDIPALSRRFWESLPKHLIEFCERNDILFDLLVHRGYTDTFFQRAVFPNPLDDVPLWALKKMRAETLNVEKLLRDIIETFPPKLAQAFESAWLSRQTTTSALERTLLVRLNVGIMAGELRLMLSMPGIVQQMRTAWSRLNRLNIELQWTTIGQYRNYAAAAFPASMLANGLAGFERLLYAGDTTAVACVESWAKWLEHLFFSECMALSAAVSTNPVWSHAASLFEPVRAAWQLACSLVLHEIGCQLEEDLAARALVKLWLLLQCYPQYLPQKAPWNAVTAVSPPQVVELSADTATSPSFSETAPTPSPPSDVSSTNSPQSPLVALSDDDVTASAPVYYAEAVSHGWQVNPSMGYMHADSRGPIAQAMGGTLPR